MSQYLSFKLVNKTNPEIKIDLGYWCTSISRGISNNFCDIFKYTEENICLDFETMKSYIDILSEGIEDYKKHLHKQEEHRKENIEFLLKAQSLIVVNAIKEDIRDCEESIAEWKEEIEIWDDVKNKLNYILKLLEENSDEWNLMYRNA